MACLVTMNLAYVVTKIERIASEEGVDINLPAKRSMEEKTIFPPDYSIDPNRFLNYYRDDARRVWRYLESRWKAASGRSSEEAKKSSVESSIAREGSSAKKI